MFEQTTDDDRKINSSSVSHYQVFQRMRVQPSPSLRQPLGHPGGLFEEIEMTMTNA